MITLNTKLLCLTPTGTSSITVADIIACLPVTDHEKLAGLLGGTVSGAEHYHLSHKKWSEVGRYANERFSGLMSPAVFNRIVVLESKIKELESKMRV